MNKHLDILIKKSRQLTSKGKLALLFMATLVVGTVAHFTIKHRLKLAAQTPYEAIIKIADINGKYGHCSAVVISDEYAVTAYHCASFSSYTKKLIISEGEKILRELQDKMPTVHGIDLLNVVAQYDFIYGELLDLKYTKEDTFKILSENDVDTGIVAFSMFSKKTDLKNASDFSGYAVLKGDFTKFKKLKINISKFDTRIEESIKTCGFPEMSKYSTCTVGSYKGNLGHYGVTTSMTVPGMSGGPVLNSLGEVIGLVEATPNFAGTVFTYVLGLGIIE